MLKKLASLSLVTLLGVTLLTCSAAWAQPPTVTISEPNFSAGGPISGTYLRVKLHVTWPGNHPMFPAVIADLDGKKNYSVYCYPHPPNEQWKILAYSEDLVYDGHVTVASTCPNWYDGLNGNFTLRLYQEEGPQSNPIANVTVENDAYVVGAYQMSNAPWEGPHPAVLAVEGYLRDDDASGNHRYHCITPDTCDGSGGPNDPHMNRTKAQILDAIQGQPRGGIPANTVFYILTHGWCRLEQEGDPPQWKWHYYFGDCTCEDWREEQGPPPDKWIRDTQVQAAVSGKLSSDPPYNGVYMDTCFSAGSDASGDKSALFGSYWLSGSADTFYFGWMGERLKADNYNTFTKSFFQALSGGCKVTNALDYAEGQSGVSNYKTWPAAGEARLHLPYGWEGY